MSGLDNLAARMKSRSDKAMFQTAWRRGQKLRDQLEELMADFFIELANVGIDSEGPPDLGDYTPTWQPLSESWVARKGGDENFYFHTGALNSALVRRKPTNLFGRPVVWLEYEGIAPMKITAIDPPKKYFNGRVTKKYNLIFTPYPKVTDFNDVEALLGEESMTRYKLDNPRGQKLRPLLSPFAQWYLRVFIRSKIK